MSKQSITLMLVLLLVACAPGPTAVPASPTVLPSPAQATAAPSTRPTRTPSPTQTPPPTPIPLTPSPIPITPLTVQTWAAGPLLVEYGSTCGDRDPLFLSYTCLPRLLLYADGRLILTEYILGEGERIFQVQLDRAEACALLNTIDQAGFFDYDPVPYDQNANLIWQYDGAPDMVTGVHAWRSQYVLHEKFRVVYQDEPEPWAHEFFAACRCYSPELWATYRLLNAYAPPALEPYRSEEVLLLINDIQEIWGTVEMTCYPEDGVLPIP